MNGFARAEHFAQFALDACAAELQNSLFSGPESGKLRVGIGGLPYLLLFCFVHRLAEKRLRRMADLLDISAYGAIGNGNEDGVLRV